MNKKSVAIAVLAVAALFVYAYFTSFSRMYRIGASVQNDWSAAAATSSVVDMEAGQAEPVVAATKALSVPIESCEGAVFDVMKVKTGDTVGSFKVISVGPYRPESADSATGHVSLGRDNNIQVEFEGMANFKGILSSNNSDFGYSVSIPNASQLPRPYDGTCPSKSSSFCVKNYESVKGIPENANVSFSINRYSFIAYPSDGCNDTILLNVKGI